ncbi:MAG: hypothetical protein M1835_001747 [Candelina submexicana]|nr:MAG: hypothetical protein M1835_001747 [Candelina submexicana]
MSETNHIQFAPDDIRPIRSRSSYNLASPAVKKEAESPEKCVWNTPIEEQTSIGQVERCNIRDEDFHTKQVFKGWILFWLAYQSTGVIYGDIGTSPLYVYSSTFTSAPSYEDLLGALSLIIWALTLMVTVKYILVVLRADDEGEGGTFACFSLLSRYANIIRRDPKEASMVKMERWKSSELRPSSRSIRARLESSEAAKTTLRFLGVLGVALVMSDGVLTPAQSVLGAIQGLKVASPDIATGTIVGVTCAILVLLFLLQPLGTSKVATAFAPIVILWLMFNFAFGIYNLAVHDHTVLKAFSPYFAGHYLIRNKMEGWKSLGGILLAFTGVEALFADLGAFSRRAIQLSWLCLTYPCLLLAYIGQAAYISHDPSGYSNPFFYSVPPGTFYPSLVLSILAAIVASQAMITSTFQLLSQIMKLSYFPQIKLVHTSKRFHNHVYIPFANWLLLLGTVVVSAVYHDTTRLGNAYGVCRIDHLALIIWQLHYLIVLPVFIAFACLDGMFLSAVLTKVPGKQQLIDNFEICKIADQDQQKEPEQQWKAEGADRFQPSHLVTRSRNGELHLSRAIGGGELINIKGKYCSKRVSAVKINVAVGFGIFFDKAGDMVPTVFTQFLQKFQARPEVMILFHMRPLSVPSVPIEERYTVSRTIMDNVFRLTIRHGYVDDIVTSDLAPIIYEQLRNYTIHESYRPTPNRSTSNSPSTTSSSSEQIEREEITAVAIKLEALQKAYEDQVVYIVGKEQMRIKKGTNLFRKMVLEIFLWIRENTRSKVASMNIPVDQLVEVGFIKEV